MDEDLVYISATEALGRFRDRSLSPVELLLAQIKRAEAVEPTINAFADTYFDEALDQAKVAEERYAGKKENTRPLEGLTVSIKDEISLQGRVTTGGSLIYRDRIDTRTDVMAERLINAGAIVHARTTTPEFCLLGVTHSRIWGTTCNPHNPEYTPGGSSGGSAASLAAGTSNLSTGTDIGGSIRIPAGCCGIVGLKASYGRIPETPVFNLDFYSHSGPMTRTVADNALMFNIVNGRSPYDIASLPGKLEIAANPQPMKGKKIAYSMDLNFFPVTSDVENNTNDVLETFRSMGCIVEEVEFPWSLKAEKAIRDYLNILWGQHMKRLIKNHRDIMTDYAIRAVEEAEKSSIDDFLASLEIAAEIYSHFGPMMEDHNLFVCPTNAMPAVKADHDPWDENFTVNGIKMDPEYGWVLTHPFNMLSRCPVMSVPSGIASNNVPTGIQLVGKAYGEEAVFAAAMALEPHFGFQRPQLFRKSHPQ